MNKIDKNFKSWPSETDTINLKKKGQIEVPIWIEIVIFRNIHFSLLVYKWLTGIAPFECKTAKMVQTVFVLSVNLE